MNPAGPAPPLEMQIWLADLEALSPALETIEAHQLLLSRSERDWPVRSPPENRRWRRLARIALRIVLARAGAYQAYGVEFEAEANGKPTLPGTAIAFNASHAGGRALFVVSSLGPVGIDLESERIVALGQRRRVMIEAAAASLSHSECPSTFLQAWTCLEAFAKARGTGIGALLTELGITAAGTKDLTDADVAARATTVVADSGLEIRALQLPAPFYGSVAAPRPISGAGLVVHALDAAEITAA
jgi:phosphopantetheinyl transferase